MMMTCSSVLALLYTCTTQPLMSTNSVRLGFMISMN
jgi:hypothetical protein